MVLFGRPALEVATERQVYLPGEVVRARVRIEGRGDLALQEIRVELRRIQRFAYERRKRDSDGDMRWDREVGTEELAIDVARVAGEGTLQRGMVVAQEVALRLPESAEGTGDGGLLDTAWDVNLVLNRRRAIDVTASAPIVVLSPAALCAGRLAAGARCNAPDECAVLFEIQGQQVRAGGTFEARLIVHARQAVAARRIRVELHRVEETTAPSLSAPTRGRSDGTTVVTHQIAGAGTLPFDTPVTFPFALPVPPALAPTTYSAHGTLRWLLRGVVDRSFASDYWGEIEVNLYNGPDLPAEPGDAERGARNAEQGTGAAPVPVPDSGHSALRVPRSALVLTATAPPALAGRTFTLDADETTLGRRETNTIELTDPTVSREHAAIRRVGAAFLVRDLGSTGGTTVNGEPVAEERVLRAGDVLGVGRVVALRVGAEG